MFQQWLDLWWRLCNLHWSFFDIPNHCSTCTVAGPSTQWISDRFISCDSPECSNPPVRSSLLPQVVLSEQCSLLTACDFDIEIYLCDLIGLITPGVPLFDNEPIRKCHTAALKAYRFHSCKCPRVSHPKQVCRRPPKENITMVRGLLKSVSYVVTDLILNILFAYCC